MTTFAHEVVPEIDHSKVLRAPKHVWGFGSLTDVLGGIVFTWEYQHPTNHLGVTEEGIHLHGDHGGADDDVLVSSTTLTTLRKVKNQTVVIKLHPKTTGMTAGGTHAVFYSQYSLGFHLRYRMDGRVSIGYDAGNGFRYYYNLPSNTLKMDSDNTIAISVDVDNSSVLFSINGVSPSPDSVTGGEAYMARGNLLEDDTFLVGRLSHSNYYTFIGTIYGIIISHDSHTQAELNAITEDYYGVFQSVSDTQDQHELVFESLSEQSMKSLDKYSVFNGETLVTESVIALYEPKTLSVFSLGSYGGGGITLFIHSTGYIQAASDIINQTTAGLIQFDGTEHTIRTEWEMGGLLSVYLDDVKVLDQVAHGRDNILNKYLTLGVNELHTSYTWSGGYRSFKMEIPDKTSYWIFDQWQQNSIVYDEFNREPLILTGFPETGGFVRETGVSADGVYFDGTNKYLTPQITDLVAGDKVTITFTSPTTLPDDGMYFTDSYNSGARGYFYVRADTGAMAYRSDALNATLDGSAVATNESTPFPLDGQEHVLVLEATATVIIGVIGVRYNIVEGFNGFIKKVEIVTATQNCLLDLTATTPNKVVPDIAYHADGIPLNGTLNNFDNLYLTDKITTLTGQKFDGETSASIPLWAAAGDFRIEGSFLFSPNIAIALGYTLDETNVIGCIETGAVRARYGGDSGNTKLDISGFTTDEVINFVFERIGDQTTFTANEVTTDPSTNTGTVYFDTIGAFFDPLQNFFDNVIGTLKLTEAGGDNREYDFKNRIIGSELIDNGVGAKHGVVTGQLEHINADSYNEVIGYEFSGNSYMTFPRITLDGDFEINLSAIVLKNITQEVLIGSVQDGIDNMFIRIDTMDTLTVNLGGANSNQQKTFTFKSPILRGVIQDLRIARVGTVVTLTDFEGNSLTDDTWTDSDTTATFTGFAAKGIIPEFKFSGSLLKADISTETDSRSYDLTKESGTKILDVLGNQHATIINTPTSGFLPVIDRNVFTIGDGKDYGSLDDWFETEKLDATHYPIAEVYGSVAGMSGLGGMDNGFTVRSAKGQEFKGDFTDPDIAKITSACNVGVNGRIFKPTYENIMCHALDDFSNSYSIDLVIRNCGLLNQLTLDAPETKVNANNSVFVGSQAVQLDTSSQTHSFSDCIFVGNLAAAGVWGVINPIGDSSYPIQLTNCIGITNGTRFSALASGVSCTNVLTNATEQLLGAEVDANVASYLLHSPVDNADIANTDARIDAANTAAMTALRYKGWNGTNICDWAYVEVVSGQLSLAVELSAIFDLYTAATAQQSTSADLLNAASHGQSTEADLYASVEIVHTTLMDAYSEVSTAQGTLVDLYNSANVSQTATVDLYQASEALQQTLQDLYSAVSVAQTTLMDLAEASRFFGEKQQSTLMDLCAAVQTVQNTLVDLYVSNSFGQTTLFDLYTLSAFSQSTLVNLNVSGQSTQSTLMGLYESVQVSQDTLMSLYGSVASTHNTFLDLYASLTKDHGTSVDLYSFSQVDQSALQDLYTYLGHEQVELNDLYVAGNQVQSTYVDLGEYELRVIAKRKITIQNTRYRFTVGNEFASIDLSKFNY